MSVAKDFFAAPKPNYMIPLLIISGFLLFFSNNKKKIEKNYIKGSLLIIYNSNSNYLSIGIFVEKLEDGYKVNINGSEEIIKEKNILGEINTDLAKKLIKSL